MTAQTGKSSVLGSLGGRLAGAVEDNMKRAPEVGNPQMPAGVNGIAELRELKIDRYKEGDNVGKPYFMGWGIAKTPDQYKGRKVAGLRTQIGPEPLFETSKGLRKTEAEHLNYWLDNLRVLGLDSYIEDLMSKQVHGESEEARSSRIETALIMAMKHLADQRPHFRFRTTSMPKSTAVEVGPGRWKIYECDENDNPTREVKKYAEQSWGSREALMKAMSWVGKDPFIEHRWDGICEAPPVNSAAKTEDNSAPAHSVNGSTKPPTGHAKAADTGSPNADGAYDDPAEMSRLVAAAEADDVEAKKKLTRMAREKGATDQQIEDSQSWQEVMDLIVNGPVPEGAEGSGEGEGENDEEWAPAVTDMYKFQVLNKNGQPLKDKSTGQTKLPVDCQVTAVDHDKKTVTLLSNTDGKTEYKNVPWGNLIRDAE